MRVTRERLADAKLLPPAKSQVERDLANGPIILQGLESCSSSTSSRGWREPCDAKAAADGLSGLRADGDSAKGADGFRLPADLYAFRSSKWASDCRANRSQRWRARHLPKSRANAAAGTDDREATRLQTADYRDVIRALKKEQLVGDAIALPQAPRGDRVDHRARTARHAPRREARIRIATDAEAAQNPAPNGLPGSSATPKWESSSCHLNIPAAPGQQGATDLR